MYPVPRKVTNMPKHQELVGAMLKGKFAALDELLSMRRPNSLMFLSAEGLSGHLDRGEARSDWLSSVQERLSSFDVEIFLMTREKNQWLRSYYQQTVRNPPNSEMGYATGETLQSFSCRPRIQALLDFETLSERCRLAFGANRVHVSSLETDWAEQLCALLGVPDMAPSLRNMPRQNQGLSIAATELLRQANSMGLDQNRDELIELLEKPTKSVASPISENVLEVIDGLTATTAEEGEL